MGKKLPMEGPDTGESTRTINNWPHFCTLGQATQNREFPTLLTCGRLCALGELHAYEGQMDWGVGFGAGGGCNCAGTNLAAGRPSRRNGDFAGSGSEGFEQALPRHVRRTRFLFER